MTAGRPRAPARVFVVGCARSGTTLVQSLLAAHPQVVSFPESSFFAHLRSGRPWKRALGLASGKGRRRLERFLSQIGEQGARAGLFERGCVRTFCETLDRIALERGAGAWVEKSPRHVQHVDYIARAVERARFVHVLRDGSDVVASLYDLLQRYPERWGRLRDLDGCIERWIAEVEPSRRCADRPGHHLVRYERLVAEPEDVVTGICAFLGLAFQPSMLHAYASEAEQLTRADEPWKRGTGRPIARRASKLGARFGPEERARIRARVARAGLDDWLPAASGGSREAPAAGGR